LRKLASQRAEAASQRAILSIMAIDVLRDASEIIERWRFSGRRVE
jgi:hypothetical protein